MIERDGDRLPADYVENATLVVPPYIQRIWARWATLGMEIEAHERARARRFTHVVVTRPDVHIHRLRCDDSRLWHAADFAFVMNRSTWERFATFYRHAGFCHSYTNRTGHWWPGCPR